MTTVVTNGSRSTGAITFMPPEDDAMLSALDASLHSGSAYLVDVDGHKTEIPAEIHDVLRNVVEMMQAGRAIVLTPANLRMTTGEAASFLGVSRPTLVKLLEEGKIPFEKPNRHRYVTLSDLEEYVTAQRHVTRASLDFLIDDAVESGLYDLDQSIVEKRLRQARGKE